MFDLQVKFLLVFGHGIECHNETLIFETKRYSFCNRKKISLQQFFDKIEEKKMIHFFELPEFFIVNTAKSKVYFQRKITLYGSDEMINDYDLAMIITKIEGTYVPIVSYKDR